MKTTIESIQAVKMPFEVTPEGDLMQNGNLVLGIHTHHTLREINRRLDMGLDNFFYTVVNTERLIIPRLQTALRAVCEMEIIGVADIAIDHLGITVVQLLRYMDGKQQIPSLLIDQLIEDFDLNRGYLYDINDQDIFRSNQL